MAGRRARAGLALTAVGLTVAGCGLSKTKNVVVNHTHTVTVTVTRTVTATTAASTDPCSGGQLSGRFAVVAGSSGAGQIAYALKLTNTSQTSCSVLLAQVQLLDSNGSPLPTHLSGSTGASVLLSAGASAVANARFSPDVSGQGDSQGGPCQPTAHTLLVSLASGSVDAPIQPPTTVCEQGRLTFQPLAAG